MYFPDFPHRNANVWAVDMYANNRDFLEATVAAIAKSCQPVAVGKATAGEMNCVVVLASKRGLSALAASLGEVNGVEPL